MPTMLHDLVRRLKYGRPVVIVSGLPRSGTSMAMKMLEAGGLALVVDNVRTADVDNPKGYYEDERVKDLAEMEDTGWFRAARGKVIKVVSSLLNYLPASNAYRVVFMRRNLHEVLASQAKMLDRRDEASHTEDQELLAMYEAHLEKVQFQLRFRSNFETLYVNYADVVSDPLNQARLMAEFVGGGLDVEKMAAAVDGSLYRNRAADDGAVAGADGPPG
ncbi:MAG: sulfotransferase domain-containing protein [Acidobacteriota bacterium]|nr:sulfotransferase domain-containing protein [Acidobacteriota bacterium]